MASPLSRNAILGIAALLAAAIFLSLAFTCSALRVPNVPHQPVVVTVSVHAPGYSATDLEALVTKPLESQLAGLASLRSLRTWTTEGRVLAQCIFGAAEPSAALDGVRERLSDRDLPEDVEPPVVSLAAEYREVARFQLLHDDLTVLELSRLHDERIRPVLLAIEGVRHVQTCGAGTTEARVELDERRLEAMGISVGQTQRALSERLAGDTGTSLEALGRVVLDGAREQPLRLSDIATLSLQEVPHCVCLVDGKPALCVSVYGLVDDAETKAKVLAEVNAWKEQVPSGLRVLVSPEGNDGMKRYGLWTDRTVEEKSVREQASKVAGAMKTAGAGAYRVRLRVSSGLASLTGPVGEVSFAGDPERVRTSVEGAAAMRMTPAEGDAWEFAIRGPDLAALRAAAKKLDEAAIAEGADFTITVGTAKRKSVEVKLNRERASSLGVGVHVVASSVRLAMNGAVAGFMEGSDGRIPVRIMLGSGEDDPAALSDLRIPKRDGSAIPLSEMCELVARLADDPIVREDQQRVVYVRVWGQGDGWPETVGKAASRVELPSGVTVEWRRPTLNR